MLGAGPYVSRPFQAPIAWHARDRYRLFTCLSAHSRYGLHVSAPRGRAAIEPTHRSIHPNIPGVPWWAALLLATLTTAIGYGIDAGSGHKELTHVFAACYVAGCVAAVLAVRQAGVFTAVIQPPLILFCAVPGAYWLFHGRKVGNIKDLLINCGYPLIERFPLMLGTAGGVLLIGLFRWYFGMSRRATAAANAPAGAAPATTTGQKSFVSGIAEKLNSMLGLGSHRHDDEDAAADAPRVRASGPPPKPGRPARSSRAARSTRTRSQNGRPLEDQYEARETLGERPRRQSRRSQAAARDFDPADQPRRSRRRPMPDGDPDLRAQPPREMRPRRTPYDRPFRGSRPEPRDRYEPLGAPEHLKPYEPYEPYEQPRRRTAPNGTNGSNGANPTHHPISRVRYRGSALGDGHRDDQRDEPRAERRGRPRMRGRSPAESWEYDA
jgi:hypothetical protein